MDTNSPEPHEHRDVGFYVDGKRQGRWIEYHTDGSAGEGRHVDNKKQGHWIERYVDGTVTEGRYVDGVADGHWVFRHANGTVSEGRFVNGKKHGHWVIRFVVQGSPQMSLQSLAALAAGVDGSEIAPLLPYLDDSKVSNTLRGVAQGPIVYGEPHGRWVIRYADGRVQHTTFRNGKVVE